MIDQNPMQEDLDEKVQVVEPENAVQEREPGVPPPGTQHLKNPVQVVNMYLRQFSQEAVDFGVEWQKSKGERGSAPMFMRANLPGEWSAQGGKLFYTADGKKRELVPTEDVQNAIKKMWYRQDVPKGIHSFHSWVEQHYIGISRRQVAEFVKAQTAWQLVRPLQKKKPEYRRSVLAKRPFSMVEIDIADLVSFGNVPGRQAFLHSRWEKARTGPHRRRPKSNQNVVV